MSRVTSWRCGVALLAAIVMAMNTARAQWAFPGAEGFGAVATGGRGGAVLFVTTLDPDPAGTVAGSLNWALAQSGPRTIVFKVSGVIHGYANVVHGDVTIAGQTSPGGVIVRGFVCDGHYERNACDNLIVRHLRLRPGWNLTVPVGGDRLDDGLRIDGASRFIFDHVSIANATDEAVQLSWASQGTIQHSILGETVGDHADRGGMLLNYSHPEHPQDQLTIAHNLWYRIGGRLPEVTCEASAYPGDPGSTADCQTRTLRLEVSHNYYFDPGFLFYYNRDVDQNAALGPYRVRLNLIGNRLKTRASYPYGLALHDYLDVADNELFVDDNRLDAYPAFSDYALFYCCNDFASAVPNTDLGVATRRSARHAFPAVTAIAAAQLPEDVARRAGAFPRDPMDRRYIASVTSGVIPDVPQSTPLADDAFDLDFPANSPPTPPIDSDNDGMPDAFEQQYAGLGLNPLVDDRNGAQLSLPLTGVSGYTNLECYLNALADSRVTAAMDVYFVNGFE